MLNLIIGRSGSGKSERVREMIQSDIEAKKEVVLIVPEQETVIWERKMADLLPVSANLLLEITNFTRLANSVFRRFGGLADTVIDDGSRFLLAWRAMLSVWDSLEVYRMTSDRRREDRNVPHLLRAIDELKESGISPVQAEEALDRLIKDSENDEKNSENDNKKTDSSAPHKKNSGLIARLKDAILVYSAYDKILHEEFIDRGDVLNNFAEALKKHKYFEGKNVYVDSFFSLTKAEMRILSHMIAQSASVTMTFLCPPPIERVVDDRTKFDFSDSEDSDGEIQFDEVRDYLRRVRSIAERQSAQVNVIPMRENMRHKNNPEMQVLERYIFDYLNEPGMLLNEQNESEWDKKSLKKTKNVHIWTCADKYDEAEACAAIIDKLVYEGYKYSEIAVVARDINSREGIVDTVIRRHGVRCFLSESSEISQTPAVRFVLALLAVVSGGWQRVDIIRLLKTGLTPVGKGEESEWEAEIFERYTATWDINGRKMYTADAWSMNPDGYKTEVTEYGFETIRIVNAAKDKLIPALERFAEGFENTRTNICRIAENIVQIAEQFDIMKSLEQIAVSYRSLGLHAQAEKTEKSWDFVCEIFDKMTAIAGEAEVDADRFAGLFSKTAAAMDVGTIPTAIDEVVLGSSSGVRIDAPKCIIMLGSIEGEFPGAVSEERTFFGSRDKIELEGVGLSLSTPDRELMNSREYFMYYRTAAMSSEKLYILCPIGEGENPSEGVRRLEKIFETIGLDVTEKFGEIPLEDLIFNAQTAEYLMLRASDDDRKNELKLLIEEIESTNIEQEKLRNTQDRDNLNTENIVISDKKRLSLSQSKIETFVSCPYNYACKYEMDVKPEPRAEIRSVDVGNFVHRVLERFFFELPKEKLKNDSLTYDEIDETVDGIVREYILSLARSGGDFLERHGDEIKLNGRLEYLFTKLKRNVLIFADEIVKEFKKNKFEPYLFEKRIGLSEDDIPPLEFVSENGNSAVLKGIVDRIDKYTDENGKIYIRIVDYKTGSKAFSLEEIEKGYGIQLLIYLFSVWKFTKKDEDKIDFIPAGAQYYVTKPSIINFDKKPDADETLNAAADKIEKSGIYWNDEDVLRLLDPELEGEFIPVKIGKDGAVKPTNKSAVLADSIMYSEIYHKLESIIKKITDEISNGKSDPMPKFRSGKLPCEWCENKYICSRKF